MVGKNNKKVLIEKQGNKYYRYSIKKLSVGVASVAVSAGFLFAGRDAVQVKAAEVLDGEENALTQDVDQSDGDGLQLEDPEENPAPETFSETVEEVEEVVEQEVAEEAAPAQAEAPVEETAEESVEEPAAYEEAEVTSEDSVEETDASPAEESAGQVEEEAPVSDETTGAEEGLETEAAETQELLESEEQADGETAETEESAESLDLPETPAELASEEGGELHEEESLTDSELNRNKQIDIFSNEVLTSGDPLNLIRNELSEVYDAKDVKGILSYVNLDEVNSPETLKDAILTAGVDYANSQVRPHVFATRAISTRAAGQNVNDRVNAREIKFTSSPDPNNRRQLNTINQRQHEVLYLYANFDVDDSVTAGDYFTVSLNEYVRPGSLRHPIDVPDIKGDNFTLAQGSYDPNSNTATYTFTNVVDQLSQINAFVHMPLTPITEKITNEGEPYQIQVNFAGEQHSENVTYNFEKKYET